MLVRNVSRVAAADDRLTVLVRGEARAYLLDPLGRDIRLDETEGRYVTAIPDVICERRTTVDDEEDPTAVSEPFDLLSWSIPEPGDYDLVIQSEADGIKWVTGEANDGGSGSAGDSDAQDLPAGWQVRYRMSYTGGSTPSLTLTVLGTTDVAKPRSDRSLLLRLSRNPSPGPVRIEYGLTQPGEAIIECFDVAGRRLKRWVVNHSMPGVNFIDWDGAEESGVSQPPGVYFVRLRAEGRTRTARGVILR